MLERLACHRNDSRGELLIWLGIAELTVAAGFLALAHLGLGSGGGGTVSVPLVFAGFSLWAAVGAFATWKVERDNDTTEPPAAPVTPELSHA